MSYLTALYNSTASAYDRAREIMSQQYDIQCLCRNCGWEDKVDVHEVDYFTLEDIKNDMTCPECGVTKDDFEMIEI